MRDVSVSQLQHTQTMEESFKRNFAGLEDLKTQLDEGMMKGMTEKELAAIMQKGLQLFQSTENDIGAALDRLDPARALKQEGKKPPALSNTFDVKASVTEVLAQPAPKAALQPQAEGKRGRKKAART